MAASRAVKKRGNKGRLKQIYDFGEYSRQKNDYILITIVTTENGE